MEYKKWQKKNDEDEKEKKSGNQCKTDQTESRPPNLSILEQHGFHIIEEIGSGTYAKVKLAYSDDYKTNVAVKIISKVQAPKEYLRKFLPREIEVVKGLQHPNLIRFFKSIETTHRVYIIMQYAENGSLLDLIKKDGHLSEIRSRKYFSELISAIKYCHERGVVHRDIKCENLLFDKNFNLKLIDFGFARKDVRPIISRTFCGSYAYASPEILKSMPYEPQRSDIWASGVVLFAMIFGTLPYDATDYSNLVKIQKKIIFPETPEVGEECKNLIIGILAPIKIRYSIKDICDDPWFKALNK